MRTNLSQWWFCWPVVGTALVATLLAACERQESQLPPASAPANQHTPEPAALAIEKPRLGESRLEQLVRSNAPLSTFTATLHQRPPFYAGALPIEYEIGRIPGPMGAGGPFGGMIDVYHSFGKWRNEFFYHLQPELEITGLASGARTVEVVSTRVLAEAKLTKLIHGKGFDIDEFHYRSDGAVTFYCKSRFDFDRRIKSSESNTRGRKEHDYFFLWSQRF